MAIKRKVFGDSRSGEVLERGFAARRGEKRGRNLEESAKKEEGRLPISREGKEGSWGPKKLGVEKKKKHLVWGGREGGEARGFRYSRGGARGDGTVQAWGKDGI